MNNSFQHTTDLPEGSESVEINPTDIRVAAMNFLARREHSVQELRKKLTCRFAEESMVDEQILRLTSEGLQSNARFAESYALQRTSRGYGPVRLREELRERGVSEADIDVTINELSMDWCALASEVLNKKFGALAPSDLKEKARRVRFLQYRGFATDHYQVLLRN
jgi:regulatory protein